MPDDVDAIKDAMTEEEVDVTDLHQFANEELLSTGSTMLNMACTGKSKGGYVKGTAVFIPGKSSSGKTWLALSCFAEACKNERFDDYLLGHNCPENGALMDLPKFFGQRMAARYSVPRDRHGNEDHSATIQQAYYRLNKLLDGDKPFIEVIDSMDALSSEEEMGQFIAEQTAWEKDKDTPGNYGDGKAKYNSRHLRGVINRLKENGSILIILAQTRDNIGRQAMFQPEVYAGGRALKFYTHLMFWTSQRGKLKTTYHGKDREQGIISHIKFEKNRFTGRMREIEIPIYHSYGIDDVGSCVNYLIEEGAWKSTTAGRKSKKEGDEEDGTKATKGSKYIAADFNTEGTVEQLVQYVEANNLHKQLRLIVEDTWNDIEEAIAIKRQRRYD